MIEFRLVTLNLSEVAVVKVPRVLEIDILKNDNATSIVTNCKIVPGFIKSDRAEYIRL